MAADSWVQILSVGMTAATAVTALLVSYAREKNRETVGRQLVPKVQYDLDCRFSGPIEGQYLAELRILADNTGGARRNIGSVQLRLRAIAKGKELSWWGEPHKRVEFAVKLLDDDLIPQIARRPDGTRHYYYIEPGVRQIFTYVTMVPADNSHVLFRVRIRTLESLAQSLSVDGEYDGNFDEERLFELSPKS